MTVGSDLFLRGGFSAEGGVVLVGAAITGQVDCTDGAFVNPGGVALNGDAMTVGASLFLRDGFRAEGGVVLVGAAGKSHFDPTGVVLVVCGVRMCVLDGRQVPKHRKVSPRICLIGPLE
jgi:hypothetical protein